jgi:hypothetical protein
MLEFFGIFLKPDLTFYPTVLFPEAPCPTIEPPPLDGWNRASIRLQREAPPRPHLRRDGAAVRRRLRARSGQRLLRPAAARHARGHLRHPPRDGRHRHHDHPGRLRPRAPDGGSAGRPRRPAAADRGAVAAVGDRPALRGAGAQRCDPVAGDGGRRRAGRRDAGAGRLCRAHGAAGGARPGGGHRDDRHHRRHPAGARGVGHAVGSLRLALGVPGVGRGHAGRRRPAVEGAAPQAAFGAHSVSCS